MITNFVMMHTFSPLSNSGYHTIALTSESSQVYTWGHNRVGQLGFPISEHVAANAEGGYFVARPTWVKSVSDLKITKVVAGWGHSAILTASGTVYTCGRNFQGQVRSHMIVKEFI